MADEPKWEPIEAPPWATKPAEPKWEPIEAPSWATKKEERGGVSEALRPITTYPETQREMAKESLGQIAHGVEQLQEPTGGDLWKSTKAAVKGVGNVGLGAIGYVGSPVTAAYRTVVGQPVQDVTGIPREYTEFAAQLATPGLGLPRMPGGAPTLTGAETRAARQIEKKASDIGAVKEKLATEPTEIVPGSRQTTFEMTEDPGLGAAERKARLRTPTPFVEQAETRAGARLQALEGAQPTGSVADVTEHLRRTRASEQRAIENDVALADQRAREAAELPGGGYDPETHGNVMRQELRNAEEATRAAEGAVWREVDPNGALRLDPMPLQQTERSIYGVMPEGGAAEASLTAPERQLTDIIQNYPARIPLQELRDFTSLLTSRMREELWTNGRSPAYARMSRLRQGVSDAEDNVIGALGQRDTGLVERLREARTATRERAERFEAKPVGDVLQREGAQGPYKVQPAQVADKLIPQGNKGYDVASNYLRATGNESLGVYTEALAGKLQREVLRADGTVDPRKLEGFVRRYDGVLRAINERDGGAFAQSLRDVGQTQERLAATTARQRAVAERWEDGELGKLVGATDNEHAIGLVGNIFDRANSVPLAREMATAVSGSPAAQAGLRRAVQQYVRRNYVGNTEAAGGTPLIQANKFQTFVKENEAALRQIMTPEQVDAWKAIATEMGRTTRIGQTKTLPGSDTAQNLASLGESWPWYAADTALSFMATGIPTPIAHIAKPALKGLLGHFKKNGITSANKIVDEAMLNPDVARKLLTMEKKTSLLRRVPGAVARTGALSGSSLSAEQQQAPRQAGGGVPAIGGTGGRSPGATETSRAGEARQRSSQALQDGGAAGDQEADPSYETKLTPGEEHVFQSWKQKYAPQDSGEDYDFRGAFKAGAKPDPRTNHWVDTFKKPNHPTFSDQSQYAKDRPDLAGSWDGDTYVPPQGRAEGGEVAAQPQPGLRERWGALQSGTIASGGGGKQGKNPAPLLRKDIVDTLKRHGINDKEVLSGWAEGQDVDSRAEGGAVDGSDERQGFMPPGGGGSGDWPIGMPRKGELDTVAGEMQDQTRAAQLPTYSELRWRPEGLRNFMANAPRSTNIEDRSGEPPVSKEESGYEAFAGPTGDLSDSSLARTLGYGSLDRYLPRRDVPLPRVRPSGRADGGEVGRDRWQSLPSSRNIEDRRGEDPLSIGQLVAAGNPYAYVNPYRTPRNRAPAAMSAHAYQEGGGVEPEGEEKLPPAIMGGWERPGGFEESAARTRRRAPVREPDPASLAASQGRVGWKDVAQDKAEKAIDWAATPGRAYQHGLTPEEEIKFGVTTAGNLAGPGMGRAGVGQAGIFGGRLAKTADLDMLRKAELLRAGHAEPERIFGETGWYIGPEGKPRFEISDQGAKLLPPAPRVLPQMSQPSSLEHRFGPLPTVVEHPEYFKAYPQAKEFIGELVTDRTGGQNRRGFYQPSPDAAIAKMTGVPPTQPFIHATGRTDPEVLSTLLHEMQHGAQDIERFTPGSSPTSAAKLLGPHLETIAARMAAQDGLVYQSLPVPLQNKYRTTASHGLYSLMAGEVEARNVAGRWESGMWPGASGYQPPWKTEQYPRDLQNLPTGQKRKPLRPASPYQEGGSVEGEEKPPALPPGLVEEWGDPSERAAYRQVRGVRPRSFTHEGRQEGLATELIGGKENAPVGPLDVATATLGGRFRAPVKIGAMALGALLEGLSPAEAGRIKTLVELGFDPAHIRRMLEHTKREGGGTFNPMTGVSPTEGRMMGTYSNVDPRNLKLPPGQELTGADLEAFMRRNEKALKGENRFVGTWRDPETGQTYVDLAQRFPETDVRQATKFGERTGQIAGYNLGPGQQFPVGNWREFIGTPEFHKRMREMEEVGHEYLKNQRYPDWWTNEPFVRVYGERRLPQVAGYTAATAPNAAPRENLQTMSEYMRRSIKGEPIVQPNWRVPEGTMSRKAGSEIGMEESRVLNLQRAERGALDELSRNKVREEAAAFMGDPSAVVLDRHQIRLSEAPERGIFASTQEGTIKSVPLAGGKLNDYEHLKHEFTELGARTGRDPNPQSADIWTGIRDTIQRTDQLYGTPYRGSAIPGESKSYADHVEDLLEDKAKHLNISKQKMESELRNGNENLLSWLLTSTPALYAAYRQWQGPQSHDSAVPSSDRNQPSGDAL